MTQDHKKDDENIEIIVQCCYCHRIKIGEDKTGNPVYDERTPKLKGDSIVKDGSVQPLQDFGVVSHGICPPCYERVTIDYYKGQARLYNPRRPGGRGA